MKDTIQVEQKITVTIKGQTFELTTQEAEGLRDRLVEVCGQKEDVIESIRRLASRPATVPYPVPSNPWPYEKQPWQPRRERDIWCGDKTSDPLPQLPRTWCSTASQILNVH